MVLEPFTQEMVFLTTGTAPVIVTVLEEVTDAIVPVPACVAVTEHPPGFNKFSVDPVTEQMSPGVAVKVTTPPPEAVAASVTVLLTKVTEAAGENAIVCEFLVISMA
jgi:hypothetical protein